MTTLKMFVVLARKPGLSVPQFEDHWRHPHVTLGGAISTVRHLVQSFRIDSQRLGAGQGAYDGVVEAWFDSAADAQSLPQHPTYRSYLHPDEPAFVDMSKIEFVFMDEVVQISACHPNDPVDGRDDMQLAGDLAWREWERPVTTKLLQFFDREAAARVDTAREADLGQGLRALRHVWSTVNTQMHAEPPAIVAVRELWWPTASIFERCAEGNPRAFGELGVGLPGTTTLLARAERIK